MSDINIITAMRSSILATTSKSSASQTVATPQPEPAANDSSATISQAARDALAASVVTSSAIPANSEPFFKQAMAEKFAGRNQQQAMIQADPSNSMWAKQVDSYARHDYTAGSDVVYDISHTMSGASGNPKIDGILRYSSGEIVTAESQTYATKQTANFQNKLREMIDSEKSKGTAPSDILLKIFDLQETQPARFRSMMMWPNSTDFASNQSGATSADKTAPSPTGVVVTLSAQARNASKEVALNSYAPLFAGRDNLPQSFALSNGVTNVSNVGDRTAGGEQKSFKQVAVDARASMDAQYAAMKDSGKPFDMNSREGKDWNSLMGNLDRRSLYAVRSNEGGQFSKAEQDMAQSFMVRQQGLAMGLYSGPISKEGTFKSPFGSLSDGFKNGIKFLDSVSSEEKSSVEWAVARASAQIGYESVAENERKVPEKLDSESPLAQLITTSMKARNHHPNSANTTGWLLTANDLKRQPWFQGYETQLDRIMQQTQDKPLLQSDAKLGVAAQNFVSGLA